MANQRTIKELVDVSDLDYFSSINDENTWLNGFNKESYLKLLDRPIPNKMKEEWRYSRISDAIDLFFAKAKLNKNLAYEFKDSKSVSDDIYIYFFNGHYYHNGDFPPYISTLRNTQNHTYFESRIFNDNHKKNCLINDLNTILLSDMLSIETKSNQKIDKMIKVINLSHKDSVLSPRISIKLANNSSVKVFEHHQSSESSIISNNIDIYLEENSQLDYFKLMDKQIDSHDLSSQKIHIGMNSKVNLFSFDSGANTSRSNIDVELDGDNSSIDVNTLFTPSESLHSGNQLKINHKAKNTKSALDIRGILDDESVGVFFGKIKVHKESSKTVANMSNQNLLLSENAKVSSKPILEIYNDDVECSHSATSGNLDDEKIFYLKSRGIDELSAKKFLIQSFATKIINKITNNSMKKVFNDHLLKSLNIN